MFAVVSSSGFRNRDVTAFSIGRVDGLIPVRKATTKIRVGDRLVYCGRLENLNCLVSSSP